LIARSRAQSQPERKKGAEEWHLTLTGHVLHLHRVLIAYPVLTIFSTTLDGRVFVSHFADGSTEAQRDNMIHSSKGTQRGREAR
jgi:hypothetical protein